MSEDQRRPLEKSPTMNKTSQKVDFMVGFMLLSSAFVMLLGFTQLYDIVAYMIQGNVCS